MAEGETYETILLLLIQTAPAFCFNLLFKSHRAVFHFDFRPGCAYFYIFSTAVKDSNFVAKIKHCNYFPFSFSFHSIIWKYFAVQ
jgi:hypothetical protein